MPIPNPFDLRHHRSGPDGDLVERFLATYENRQTRRNYRTDLRQFFDDEEVTRHQVRRVQEDDVNDFLQQRVDSLKRGTLERKLEVIRSFFRWLAEQNLIEELPIGESADTGDLIDSILEESSATTQEDGSSKRSFYETALPDEGSPIEGGGLREKPDPGQDGSPSSRSVSNEAPSRGERKGRKSSSVRSEDSDTGSSGEDSPKVDSAGEPVVDRGSDGDRSSGKISADEASIDEGSDEGDPTSIPQWAFPSGNTTDIDLKRGENFALEDLPDALCGGLRKLEKVGGAEGLFLRCTDDLAMRIQYRQDLHSPLAEVTIEHRRLEKLGQRAGGLSEAPALRQAILYLAGRGWALPRCLYDRVDALPDSADAEGSFSEGRPKWTQEKADNQMVRMALAGEVTGALAQGFGVEKNEDVFLGL